MGYWLVQLLLRVVVGVQLVGFLGEQVGTNLLAVLSSGSLRAGENHCQFVLLYQEYHILDSL